MDKAIDFLYLAGITLAGLLLLAMLATPLIAIISSWTCEPEIQIRSTGCVESTALLPVEADVAFCAPGARVSWRRVDEGYLVTCRCDTPVEERLED